VRCALWPVRLAGHCDAKRLALGCVRALLFVEACHEAVERSLARALEADHLCTAPDRGLYPPLERLHPPIRQSNAQDLTRLNSVAPTLLE